MTRAFSWLLVALAVVLTGPTQSHAESALVAPQAAAADRESPERLPHARGARAPIERTLSTSRALASTHLGEAATPKACGWGHQGTTTAS